MAAVDIYLNETTRHADVILPPTTALERDQYDLVFHALAVRNTARFTPAVFDKPEDALHDWEIFRELALRTSGPAGAEEAAGARRSTERPGSASARRRSSPALLLGRPPYDDAGAAGEPGGRRPRPAAADDAGAAADHGQADRPRPGPGGRRPRPAARDASPTPGRATSCC